jgi:hypothetical protein
MKKIINKGFVKLKMILGFIISKAGMRRQGQPACRQVNIANDGLDIGSY